MNKRTLVARVKDFESLMNTTEATIPIKAVRKLYKITRELIELIAHTEGRLAEAVAKSKLIVKPTPLRYHNPHANQMKEMAAEIKELKEEIRVLKLPTVPNKPFTTKHTQGPKVSKSKSGVKSAWDHKETIVTNSNPMHKDISYTPKQKK